MRGFPKAISAIDTEFLLHMNVELEPAQAIGRTPAGARLTFVVRKGTFAGPRLKGRVLPGGADWLLFSPDGVGEVDVRITLESEGGELVHAYWSGVLKPPANALERLARGESIKAEEMYFRTVPRFQTAAPSLLWLNEIVAVGVGSLGPGRVTHDFFHVL